MSEPATVLVERPQPGVAILRLNRPARLNALVATMFAELRAVCEGLQSDDEVRAVVLTGSGRGFCAGYDLDEAAGLAGLSAESMLARQDLAHASLLALRNLRQPVIAAVGGPSIGGGLCLALAADVRIASPSAKFSAAFVRLGLSAGDMGCSWLLPRIVGPGHAAELMFTGAAIDAAEAARIGLVSRIVPAESLLAESLAVAGVIAGHSPFAMGISKRALQASQRPHHWSLALNWRPGARPTPPGAPISLRRSRGYALKSGANRGHRSPRGGVRLAPNPGRSVRPLVEDFPCAIFTHPRHASSRPADSVTEFIGHPDHLAGSPLCVRSGDDQTRTRRRSRPQHVPGWPDLGPGNVSLLQMALQDVTIAMTGNPPCDQPGPLRYLPVGWRIRLGVGQPKGGRKLPPDVPAIR